MLKLSRKAVSELPVAKTVKERLDAVPETRMSEDESVIVQSTKVNISGNSIGGIGVHVSPSPNGDGKHIGGWGIDKSTVTALKFTPVTVESCVIVKLCTVVSDEIECPIMLLLEKSVLL
jgi:hypothetical protein